MTIDAMTKLEDEIQRADFGLRLIAVTEAMGKQLDPSLDLVQEAMPFFMSLQRRSAAKRGTLGA